MMQLSSDPVRSAFERLVLPFSDRLDRSLVHHFKITLHTAEDIRQDTLGKAWRGWVSFKLDRPVWPWLWQIARHAAVDYFRRSGGVNTHRKKKGKKKPKVASSPDREGNAPEPPARDCDPAEAISRLDLVEAAEGLILKRLPEPHLAVWRLHLLGHTDPEIAARVHIGCQQVAKARYRIMALLQKFLNQGEEHLD